MGSRCARRSGAFAESPELALDLRAQPAADRQLGTALQDDEPLALRGAPELIVADDWVEVIGNSGNMSTKASLLDHVRSGKNKLESCEFGRDDVKVFGNVAVVQASVTERRVTDGQSTTFHVVYMDVWVKRGDRWVVARSQASKL